MSAQKKIALFLVLTATFSSLSYLPMFRAGTAGAQDGLFVLALMWSPGIAAILTQLIATRGLRGLGWKFALTYFAFGAKMHPSEPVGG